MNRPCLRFAVLPVLWSVVGGLTSSLLAQVPDPAAVHERTRPSIVAIRAMAPLGERSGSGVLIDAEGTVLTSYAVCPAGSSSVRVWMTGPHLFSQKAGEVEVLGHSERDEVTLLRVKGAGAARSIEWGSSSVLKIGDTTYTSGNASNSLINDDQPSFNAGILSGRYLLDEMRAGASYRGPVLETTAAVNFGMEGAPLLDGRGRMVGFITMNYSPHRFLGCAIPLDAVRFAIDRIRGEAGAGEVGEEPEGEGTLGFLLEEAAGRILVSTVDPEGPAAAAGLRVGDRLVAVGEVEIVTLEDFWSRVKDLKPEAILWLTVEADGERVKTKLVVGKK